MRVWLALGIALFLLTAPVGGQQPGSSQTLKGLSLSAALQRLQQQGLRLVFSSDLVRDDMVVSQEPGGRWPREILDDLLAPHGLRSRPGPAGSLLIVKAPPRSAPPVVAPKASPGNSDAPRGHAEHVLVQGGDWSHIDGTDPRQSLDGRSLENLPDHGDDPLLSVARFAGVTGDTDSGGLNVRGGASHETKIVLDGLELYEPYHLKDRGGPISLVDSGAIGSVALLGDSLPAEYGGHLSGVVQMHTLEPSSRPGGEVALASDGARFATAGTAGDSVTWVASARQGRGNSLLTALNADPGYRPSYWDLFAKVGYRPSPRTSFSFHILGGDDEAEGKNGRDLISTVRQPGTFKSRHTNRYEWITAAHTFTPVLFSELMVSHGRVTIDRAGSSPHAAALDDARSTTVEEIKNDWWLQSSRHLMKWGFDFKHASADYQYGAWRLSPHGNDAGVYVADRLRISSRVRVEVGMRWETQTYLRANGASVSPRVNADFAVGRRTVVRAGWGRLAQAQRIGELQIEDGSTDFSPPEHAQHGVLSVVHEFANGIQAQLSAYQKRMSDLHPRFENLFNPISLIPEAERDRVRLAPTAARADGLEFSLRSPAVKPVAWWAAYGLAQADDKLDGSWVARGWDQRHTLNAGVTWIPTTAWVVSAAGHIHSGRPTTPITANGFGSHNSLRLPAYSRIDVRVARSIHIHFTKLDASVTVNDLINRERAIEPWLRQGIPRVVTAGLAWKF